jgi:UDP-glucose 4-epimerase
MLEHNSQKTVNPSRVVIFGSTGFVGKYLVRRLLTEGVTVLGLGSKDLDLAKEDSPARIRNILRPDDTVVFISALTPDRGRSIATVMSNLKMSENFCGVLQEFPVRHLIYISSDALYPDDLVPVRESSPADPRNYHGYMHLGRELFLSTAARQSKTPLAILRPSLLYGAGDTHNSYGPNRFIQAMLKENKISIFGDGEEMRDHIYIEDVAELIWLCIAHRSTGLLNVATGNSTSFKTVAETIAKLSGHPVTIEKLPRGAGPINHRHFDVTGIAKAFPSFRFTSLQAGLAETIRRAKAL